MFRRNHLYKLCVICVGLKSLGPSHHQQYISLCHIIDYWLYVSVYICGNCNVSATIFLFFFLFDCIAIALSILVRLQYIFGENSHLSWIHELEKCFEFKWNHLWLKITLWKTLQNTSLAALKIFLWSYCMYTICAYMLCVSVCLFTFSPRWGKRTARSNSKSCVLCPRVLQLWINTKGHWIINTLCGAFFCFFYFSISSYHWFGRNFDKYVYIFLSPSLHRGSSLPSMHG